MLSSDFGAGRIWKVGLGVLIIVIRDSSDMDWLSGWDLGSPGWANTLARRRGMRSRRWSCRDTLVLAGDGGHGAYGSTIVRVFSHKSTRKSSDGRWRKL
jgi:hypothetical protein